ncbi:MAG TPA: O-antigen ligase family protein [Candidatus Methanoperedens sp.]|nr:O-antigen ligase family protein [Candidatus Methanoperedens sp.]
MLMCILASGAFYRLIMDGGASEFGAMFLQYSGPLNHLSTLWAIAAGSVLTWAFLNRRVNVNALDALWLCLMAYGFSASLWAEYMRTSFSTSLFVALAYALVAVHMHLSGYNGVVRFHALFLGTILIGSFLAVLFVPSYGLSVGQHEGRWQGLFTHKNTLGNLSAGVFVAFAWWFGRARQPLALCAMLASLVLIVASECSTAMFNVALVSAVFVLLRFPTIRKWLFAYRFVLVTAAIAVSLFLSYATIEQKYYFEILGKESSFTSRDQIWRYVAGEITEAPWLGHGFQQLSAGNLQDDSSFRTAVGFVVLSAHNGFIDLLHSLGVVGFLLFLLVIFRLLQTVDPGPLFDLLLMYLCYLIVVNTFESFLLGFNMALIALMYVSRMVAARVSPPAGLESVR